MSEGRKADLAASGVALKMRGCSMPRWRGLLKVHFFSLCRVQRDLGYCRRCLNAPVRLLAVHAESQSVNLQCQHYTLRGRSLLGLQIMMSCCKLAAAGLLTYIENSSEVSQHFGVDAQFAESCVTVTLCSGDCIAESPPRSRIAVISSVGGFRVLFDICFHHSSCSLGNAT
jgi:hypothetical protein